ncbi:TPA: oligosaccharide flippase family protein [Photobacterium damselae]
MEINRKLISNIINFTFIQSINYIYPLIIIPMIINKSGLSFYGNIAISQSIAQFVLVVVLFGMDQYGVKKIIQNENENEITIQIQSIRFLFLIISSLFSIFICYINVISVITLIIIIGFILQAIQPIWYYQARSNLKHVVYINIVSKILSISLLFASKTNIEIAIALSIQYVLPAIFLNIKLFKNLNADFNLCKKCLSKDKVLHIISDALPYFQTALMSTILTSTGILIVGYYSSDSSNVGIYAIIERVFKSISKVFNIFSNSLYPLSCNKYNESFYSLYNSTINIMKNTILIYLLFGFAFAILIFKYPELIKFDDFYYVMSVSILFYVWLLFGIINNFLGIQLLMASNHIYNYKNALLISGMICILLMILLGYFYIGLGVVLALLLSEFSMTVLLVFKVRVIKNENWCRL